MQDIFSSIERVDESGKVRGAFRPTGLRPNSPNGWRRRSALGSRSIRIEGRGLSRVSLYVPSPAGAHCFRGGRHLASLRSPWVVESTQRPRPSIKERLANERKAPELAGRGTGVVRDQQLSRIPALDTMLRRSARVSELQDMLAQGGMTCGPETSSRSPLYPGSSGICAFVLSSRAEVGWIAVLIGTVLPYAYASVRRNRASKSSKSSFPKPSTR